MLRGLILTAEHIPNGNGQESAPMSACQSHPLVVACPPTVDELQPQIHKRLDEIIAYCLNDQEPASFR